MHKGVILLVKAEDRDGAVKAANSFMQEFKDRVYWYAIGGRWSQHLAPQAKAFQEKADMIVGTAGKQFVSQKDVDDHQAELAAAWVDLGGTGTNPWADHYKLPDDGNPNDVLPLADCLEIVKEWRQTVEEAKKAEAEAKERWLNRTNQKTGEKFDDWHMYGYALQRVGELYQESFCFDTNVFNAVQYNYSIPEDPTGFWAVMLDMHN